MTPTKQPVRRAPPPYRRSPTSVPSLALHLSLASSTLKSLCFQPLLSIISFQLALLHWVRVLSENAVAWLFQPVSSRGHVGHRFLRSYGLGDLRRWQAITGALVAYGLAQSAARRLRERYDARARRLRDARAAMGRAVSYHEWRDLARTVDHLDENRLGGRCAVQEGRLYDRKLLLQKLAHLQAMRESGNIREMMFTLRSDLIRNVANIAKSQVHEHTYTVPAAIREWTQEVKTQLATLADWPEAGISTDEKLVFFREVRHAYGRTALLLSGGGSLGSFHIGVVKALFEHRMLPRVLAGSSVGSIVASLIATRTDDELRDMFGKLEQIELSFFNNQHTVELARHFLSRGALHDAAFLQRKLQHLVGGYTFLEAYERTGRILNVSVCPADTNEPARLLNYLTAPQALIWSAVAASSAFPGLFQPQDIVARNALGEEVPFSSLAAPPSPSFNADGSANTSYNPNATSGRRWRDGSLELDLPTGLLGEMFNCNHFIVSQCNPHIVPLLQLKKRLSRKWGGLLELELRHRCLQAQALLSDVIPTKWLTLFTQPWEGDITIVLPSALWNVGKSISNPTTEDLLRATKLGELHVWEKLSAIEANCAIEATLDACLARLTNKARERPLGGLSARIPSWLCMSGVGQQAVASWGNPLRASASAHWGPGGWRGSALDLRAAASAGAGSAGALAAAAAAAAAAPAAPGSQREVPSGPEAMAAAAAAAMAGHPFSRGLAYYHPTAAQLGGSFNARAAAGFGAHALPGGLGAAGSLGHAHSLGPPPAALPATIHEGLADERPPRVASWGSQRHLVADSVSDFPGGRPAGGGGASAAAAAAAAGDTGSVGSPRSHDGGGWLSGASIISTPRSGSDASGAAGAPAERGAAGSGAGSPLRGGGSGASGSGGSGSSRASGGVDPSVLAQMECCDATAVLDLWGLSSAAVKLQAAADGEALDVIAP